MWVGEVYYSHVICKQGGVNESLSLIGQKRANNVCTRLGVGPAFFRQFPSFGGIPFRGRIHSLPQAGNANRWAAQRYSHYGA